MDSYLSDLSTPPILPLEPPAPPPRRPWSAAALGLFVVFVAFAYFLSAFVAAAGYAALKPLMGWRLPFSALPQNTYFAITFELIFYALLLGYVIFLIGVYYRAPFWQTLRWKTPKLQKSLQFVLGGIVLSFVVMLSPTILPDKQHFPLEQMFSTRASTYTVGAFAVLIAPFMEELFFRGVLFAFFERLGGLIFATLTTAVLFGALHFSEYRGAWDHLFLTFVVGFVLSFTRAKTGSLAPSFLIHTAYNGTQIALLLLRK